MSLVPLLSLTSIFPIPANVRHGDRYGVLVGRTPQDPVAFYVLDTETGKVQVVDGQDILLKIDSPAPASGS
jgi:hypothetical protein